MKKYFLYLLLFFMVITSFTYGVAVGHYKLFPFDFLFALKSRKWVAEAVSIQEPDEIVVYKRIMAKSDSADLRLHIFKPINALQNKTVIFFFGGGWKGGAVEQFYPQCIALAEIGIGCVSAEYRTSHKFHTSPLHALEDARDALKYVRLSGQKHGLQAAKVWLGGASAGGQLAAAVAMSSLQKFDMEPLPVDGLLLFNPVIDNGITGYGYERVKFFSHEFSPMHAKFVPKIPLLFQIGSDDHHVTPDLAEAFVERFKNVGAKTSLIIYQDKGHGWFNFGDDREKTLHEMLRFLNFN